MDSNHRNLLIKLGIIMESQEYNSNLKNHHVNMGEIDFKIINSENFFRLRNLTNNLFLYYDNNNLDFVYDNKSDLFKKNSRFLILNDEICCSILPYNNYGYVICNENNQVKLKKVISCLQGNIITIFRITKEEIKIEPPIEKPVPKVTISDKNLVKLNSLTKSITNNIDYLTIVTPNINTIPPSLKKFSYLDINTNSPISILYLNFIVNNYHNLTSGILFIDQFPNNHNATLLEKKIMYGPPKDIITHLDHRITLDGLRYKYCVDGNWTDWSDITSYSSNPNFNNKIINFLKKNIKKTPKNRYLEFSRNMFYYFPHSCLTKYPLSFYNNLLKSLRQSNLNCEIMDKCWYFILKS